MQRNKANFLLISYAGYPYTPSSFMPDNGLANLAGALLKNGHEARILDYGTPAIVDRLTPDQYNRQLTPLYDSIFGDINAGKKPKLSDMLHLFSISRKLDHLRKAELEKLALDIISEIDMYNIDAVGMKLWIGEGIEGSIMIANRIRKRYPSIPIYGGGIVGDLFHKFVLKECGAFDAIALAEGEETIVDLALHALGLKQLDEINNLVFNEGGNFYHTTIKRIGDLDSLPLPVYDGEIYPAMDGHQKMRLFVVDESRGCPYGCSFCVQPVKSGKERRIKNASGVVDVMEYLQKRHQTSAFRGDGSSTPLELAEGMADEIERRKLKVRYSIFGRINEFARADPVTMKKLKESGLTAVFFGIESGSQSILDSMNKNIKVNDIKEAVKRTKEAGINVVGSLIYPAPFESHGSTKETIDLINDLKDRLDSCPTQFPGLYPKTPWWEHYREYDFKLRGGAGMDKILKKLLYYRIKLFFPQNLWDPLPYDVNGEPFRQYSGRTRDFAEEIRKKGISTYMSDEMYVMAHYLGLSPDDFVDKFRRMIFTGDAAEIYETIKKFNDKQRNELQAAS